MRIDASAIKKYEMGTFWILRLTLVKETDRKPVLIERVHPECQAQPTAGDFQSCLTINPRLKALHNLRDK